MPRTFILDDTPAPPWLGPTMQQVYRCGLPLGHRWAAKLLLHGIEWEHIPPPVVKRGRVHGEPVVYLFWSCDATGRAVLAVPFVSDGTRSFHARLSLFDHVGEPLATITPPEPVVVLRGMLRWIYEGRAGDGR